jgi:hypothetical protein
LIGKGGSGIGHVWALIEKDSKAGKEVGGEEGGKGTYEIQYAQTHHGLMSAAKQSRPSSFMNLGERQSARSRQDDASHMH